MSDLAQRLLDEALQLPLGERAAVVAQLLASIDGPTDEDADVAWTAEIERRARRALSGEVVGVPWEAAQKQIEERLRHR